jgi:hypothetical protein
MLGILFSGEERVMICRTAMAIWGECTSPWTKCLGGLIKIPDGITAPEGTEKI